MPEKQAAFDIGAEIRRIRGGMSQEEFARVMGVGRTTVVRYESNERSPDAEFLLKLNTLFAADPLHVLSGRRPNRVNLENDEKDLIERYRSTTAQHRRTIAAVAALPVADQAEEE